MRRVLCRVVGLEERFMFKKLLNKLGFYRVSDLTVGDNCGICGKWVSDEVVEKDWRWTICGKCIGIEA